MSKLSQEPKNGEWWICTFWTNENNSQTKPLKLIDGGWHWFDNDPISLCYTCIPQQKLGAQLEQVEKSAETTCREILWIDELCELLHCHRSIVIGQVKLLQNGYKEYAAKIPELLDDLRLSNETINTLHESMASAEKRGHDKAVEAQLEQEVEWDGECLPPVGVDIFDTFRKPLTQAEKEAIAREEAAFEVYKSFWKPSEVTICYMSFDEFKKIGDLKNWLSVVDLTGYRKE